MKKQIEWLRLVQVEQLSYSAKGNPRWKFMAQRDDGLLMTFKTANTASSVYDSTLTRLQSGDPILVSFHQTASGALVADSWKAVSSTGTDRSRAFAVVKLTNLVRVAAKPANPTGDHDEN